MGKMKNRKDTTIFLSHLLENTVLNGIGKYYAKEVTLDYGTSKPKRIDYLQYSPAGAVYVGDIEKGIFTCYEVKSCKEDVYSGNGLNFVGEENYIVTTMDCYKSLLPDIQSGKLNEHVNEMNDGRQTSFAFLIAVPDRPTMERFNQMKAVTEEFENTTPLDGYPSWRFARLGCDKRTQSRVRSTVELLFCMVRSGR
jgi:hypothetical protein